MNSSTTGILQLIAKAYAGQRTIAVATLLSQSGKCIKFAFDKDSTLSDCECDGFEERAVFRIAKEALASRLATEIVRMAGPNGEFTVSVEVIRPKPSIIIFGAGHVGRSLALIASLAGYEVTVIDDREEFVTRERFPNKEIHLIAGPYDEATYRVTVSPGTAVVIVTRGHQYDEQCLKDTIDSAAGYIGMIGSKRRVIAVYRRLEAAGINPERLKRVHAPIGLAIGARSPQEIAVAILAEIIQTLNSPA